MNIIMVLLMSFILGSLLTEKSAPTESTQGIKDFPDEIILAQLSADPGFGPLPDAVPEPDPLFPEPVPVYPNIGPGSTEPDAVPGPDPALPEPDPLFPEPVPVYPNIGPGSTEPDPALPQDEITLPKVFTCESIDADTAQEAALACGSPDAAETSCTTSCTQNSDGSWSCTVSCTVKF